MTSVPASWWMDAAGNAYVVGVTQSPNFPTTSGAFDRTGAAGNNLDVFVTKINSTGTALVYSTFVGGTNFDWGRGIAIDAATTCTLQGRQILEFPDHGRSLRPDIHREIQSGRNSSPLFDVPGRK